MGGCGWTCLWSCNLVPWASCRTSESFSPICLPRYNPMAFLYAYVHYLDVSGICLKDFFFFSYSFNAYLLGFCSVIAFSLGTEEPLIVTFCTQRMLNICSTHARKSMNGFFFLTFLWQVDTYLMLLTTKSDAFYHLKDCR